MLPGGIRPGGARQPRPRAPSPRSCVANRQGYQDEALDARIYCDTLRDNDGWRAWRARRQQPPPVSETVHTEHSQQQHQIPEDTDSEPDSVASLPMSLACELALECDVQSVCWTSGCNNTEGLSLDHNLDVMFCRTCWSAWSGEPIEQPSVPTIEMAQRQELQDADDANEEWDDGQIRDYVPSGREAEGIMVMRTEVAAEPRACVGGSLDGRAKRTGFYMATGVLDSLQVSSIQ